MRIALDVMGGDHGPDVIIDGARLALQSNDRITELFLVGNEEEIKAGLAKVECRDSRVKIIHASEVITMEDKPMDGVRRKRDSSILRAVELVKDGKADAIISSGNTGGIVAAASVRLRRIEGVEHPAIATVIPTEKNEFVLLDAGASVECEPIHLLHFAVMGSIYSQYILGCKSPRVGILSNGTESHKGTALTQGAAALCKLTNLNFVGNVEGHDLFNNRVDVVVCDGFVGNIVLKTIESLARGMTSWIKTELMKNPKRMFGAMMAKNAFTTIKHRMDPDAHGGAPLLGLNGVVTKAHGSARARAIMNAIRVSSESVQNKLNETIRQEIATVNQRVPAKA